MYDNGAVPPPYPASYPAPYGYPPPPPAPGTTRTGWLPILSLVVSAAALIGVIGLAVFVMSSGGSYPLTGELDSAPAGAPLLGPTLVSVITDVIEDDGGEVTGMKCPTTARVDQGVVTVCHGSIDDEDWAVVVYFESSAGRFTLQPI